MKDKFKKMQQDGGVGSFQESLVQAAKTVAAIERQNEPPTTAPVQSQPGNIGTDQDVSVKNKATLVSDLTPPRFMRLPNPQIPLEEYNLVSTYCSSFSNMTRQDFVEMAIVEKLHNDGNMSQEDFDRRYGEIRNRPPRGQRKGTKSSTK